jgi:hypothetical protein
MSSANENVEQLSQEVPETAAAPAEAPAKETAEISDKPVEDAQDAGEQPKPAADEVKEAEATEPKPDEAKEEEAPAAQEQTGELALPPPPRARYSELRFRVIDRRQPLALC